MHPSRGDGGMASLERPQSSTPLLGFRPPSLGFCNRKRRCPGRSRQFHPSLHLRRNEHSTVLCLCGLCWPLPLYLSTFPWLLLAKEADLGGGWPGWRLIWVEADPGRGWPGWRLTQVEIDPGRC